MKSKHWKALHCILIITEFAVLAIYAETISYPYMKKKITLLVTKIRICLTLALFTDVSIITCRKSLTIILIGKDIDPFELYKMATLDEEE
jgi:hypothetical protein